MQFLIEGIGSTEGVDEVVARGCIDTIAIVVTDTDVAPRLIELIDYIVQQICGLMETVCFVNFFDFMNDFVKLFADNLAGPKIIMIVNATVNRICKEQAAKESGNASDNSSIVLDKCCTILRLIVDKKQYI